MSRFATSWTIVRYSLGILRRHPRLITYPVVSLLALGLISLFLLAPMIFRVTAAQMWQSLWSEEAREVLLKSLNNLTEADSAPEPDILSLGFITYGLVSTFIMTFINVAFYGQIIEAMNGEQVSAVKGFHQALARLPATLAWSAVACTVSVILSVPELISPLFGVITGLANLCWIFVSFFVIPVMLNEPRSQTPLGYLRISMALLKRVWAESLIGVVAVFLLAVALMIVAMMISFALFSARGSDAIPVAFLVTATNLVIFAILYLALQVFECGLYVYATQGVAPGTFRAETFDRAWTVRDSTQGAVNIEPDAAGQVGRSGSWRAAMLAVGMGFVVVLGVALVLTWLVRPSAPRIVADTAATKTVQGLPKLLPPDLRGSTPDRNDSVTRTVLKEYSFLTGTPERDETAIVDIAMRTDGSVYRSNVMFATADSRQAIMSDPAVVLPQQPDDISGILFHKAGRDGENQFRHDLWIRYVILASEPDSSRDVEHVRAAMLAAHPELLLPVDGYRVNKVTAFLSEDGKVERHYVESHTRDNLRPYGDQVPEEYGRQWEALGLRLDQLGPMGVTWIYAPLEKNAGPQGVTGAMVVRYAWARRADEPMGGVPLAQRHPRIVPFLHADAADVIEHFLPGALNDKGETREGTPWLLLSRQGDVVRSGYVKVGPEQKVEAALFEAGHPGQQIDVMLETLVVRKFRESFSRRVILAWLKPGTNGQLQAASETR